MLDTHILVGTVGMLFVNLMVTVVLVVCRETL